MTPEQVDKLIDFGNMALEQGWYDQAREHFEQALELDASNREAMKGLARVNEITNRWKPTPIEPIRAEPVEPLRKVSIEPIKPEVEPAEPRVERGQQASFEPQTSVPTVETRREQSRGVRYWTVRVVLVAVVLGMVIGLVTIWNPMVPPPVPMSTPTPMSMSMPTPLPTPRSGEKYECELAAVGYNGAVRIELLLIEFGRANATLDLNAINISSRTVHISPASFILVDSTGASVNYSSCNFRGRSTGMDLAPGTYTTGWINFFPYVGEPRRLVYDGGLYGPITLNISLASCVRVKR